MSLSQPVTGEQSTRQVRMSEWLCERLETGGSRSLPEETRQGSRPTARGK